MRLFVLDYGAGNVFSLANTLTKLGHSFEWIQSPDDFDHATHLIFPGVGAFQSAINNLHTKGLLEPLLAYIRSGRPYFGICIGMQVLFQSSEENPDVKGLGIIPHAIVNFSSENKSVPHIGWNRVQMLDIDDVPAGVKPDAFYYFVHSFMAPYAASSGVAEWTHTTCQYGSEVFVSSVRRGNVYGCQFHPEKSGHAGFDLIEAWLATPLDASAPLLRRIRDVPAQPKDGLTKRIIACLDVRANDDGDLVVTKGDQYDVREKVEPAATDGAALKANIGGAVRNLGKPVDLCAEYFNAGADEICLLNITSFRNSPLQDQPMIAVVRAAAEQVFVPLTIGGGIKDTVDPDGTPRPALEVAGAYFRAGADKVSIGSDAVVIVEQILNGTLSPTPVDRPETAIESIARAYGRQAVVVSIDPKRAFIDNADSYDGPYKDEIIRGVGTDAGKAWWYQCTIRGGREARPVSVVQLAKGVEQLGAGEILVNSIDRDGSGLGFDIDLIRLVRQAVKIPVVASSGAGNPQHFVDVFEQTGVEAALAAGIFHRKEVKISDVKQAIKSHGLTSRIVP
ncbi:imidazoleglycerol phosphate synthase [Auriculariales sp. MPI-PUGE-AT-0066]|nr:imidazoleglycerol phosphate synthase [Auriculariales sp. MPI-PUGE-AT-0066]